MKVRIIQNSIGGAAVGTSNEEEEGRWGNREPIGDELTTGVRRVASWKG